MRIAIPSAAPGGLDAPMSQHFGHCEVFTIATLKDGQLMGVELMPNGAHTPGSCGGLAGRLKEARVEAVIAGGIGARPLEMLRGEGIEVFLGGSATVREAVQAYLGRLVSAFDASQACQGSGTCHGK